MTARGPLALIILDGWGLREEREGNAVALARTPHFDRLWASWPHARLGAHGEHVGLWGDQIGNSEVGHLNLGAGRVVWQTLVLIHRAIASGEFFANPVLGAAADRAREGGGRLHLLGLFSDGGVHSHIEHLFALVELALRRGLTWERLALHCFLDGRDVPPACAERYFEALGARFGAEGLARVATVSGRYYAMDRDRRWDRTRRAYEAIVHGRGLTAPDPLAALREAYARGETDEFVQPTVIVRDGEQAARLQPHDAMVFFNFRADRARQLTRALTDPAFAEFDRGGGPLPAYFATMTEYDEDYPLPVAFPKPHLRRTLGEVAAEAGLRQLRIAETEKYAHVTYFFNGGDERVFPGEERILVPSPKVATYDLQPEMSAFEVTDRLLQVLDRFDLVVLNYANPDMVGHTGKLEAAIRACEAVDACLGRVVEAVLARGGNAVVCADHGNAELMIDPATGGPHTAHTTNPVPVILVGPAAAGVRLRDGILGDVAPTALEVLGLPKPPEMERSSLIIRGA